MNIFITGATGFIGENLTLCLAEKGNIVHALYRDEAKVKNLKHPNIKLFKGDVTDEKSLRDALAGCAYVYHVAAFTDVWAKNKEEIYELNVSATESVLKLSHEMGIKKLVFTSTAGVFGPSSPHEINEKTIRKQDYFLEYERTKAIAENVVRAYVKKGMHCVIVNPTRVYGPGRLSKSNGVSMMIKSFKEGKWRVIPGDGKSIGNYVFIQNVVDGHLLAMEKGAAGANYILGGDNISYLEFFDTLKKLTGQKHFMINLPLSVMLGVSNIMMLFTRVFGIKPMITPALVKKFHYNFITSSGKAKTELGYQAFNFEEGAKKTIDWLQKT